MGNELRTAAENGDLAKVKALLEKGERQDSDVFGTTPVMLAAQGGHPECLRLLMAGQAPEAIRQRGGHKMNAWFLSAQSGSVECLELLAPFFSIDEIHGSIENSTALMLAARHGKADAVRHLLGRGANPKAEDGWGRTPLMRAAAFGHIECVRILARVSELAHRGNEGQTALESAIELQRPETVAMLVEEMRKKKPTDDVEEEEFADIGKRAYSYAARRQAHSTMDALSEYASPSQLRHAIKHWGVEGFPRAFARLEQAMLAKAAKGQKNGGAEKSGRDKNSAEKANGLSAGEQKSHLDALGSVAKRETADGREKTKKMRRRGL